MRKVMTARFGEGRVIVKIDAQRARRAGCCLVLLIRMWTTRRAAVWEVG